MTKPELYPTIIFRLPRFSYNEKIDHNWQELKECIKDSSPEFYKIIAEMTFGDLLEADTKIQVTARKYYNRAAFRSTPYGLFSAVGVTSMNWTNGEVKLAKDHKVHAFADWREKPIVRTPIEDLIGSDILLFSNTTFYHLGKDIRYIQKSGDSYQIAVVDYEEIILNILQLCCTPKTFNQISEQIDIDNLALVEYLDDLLHVQLLLTSLHPNIIGRDYFFRIGHSLENHGKQYLITERQAISGSLDQRVFRYLPELATQMQKILEVNQEEDLKVFKEQFEKKFEQAEIPLMIALDPEVGVGYGGLETYSDGSAVTELLGNQEKQAGYSGSGKLREKLYQVISANSINGKAIDLLELMNADQIVNHLPNSVHALCTIVDDQIYVDAFGGATATALSGRFATAIPEVHDYCKEIATIEQHSNPDVLLFDIGYTKEDAVDNINRRPAIYEFQLNILNFDTSPCPICINDILVSIQSGEVVLRSRSLDKRLIPRFASAYNHKRSDMPLFRFLMDTQAQGIQTNLTLRPAAIIPGLSFYPRIEFKNIIVSPATWLIERAIIKDINSNDERYNILIHHLKLRLPCIHVRTGLGDQTLLLDTTNKDDLYILLSLLEHVDQLYLEEAYLPKKSAFTNMEGQQFLPQVVATITHTNQIWNGMRLQGNKSLTLEKKEWVSPGREWIYFEIYGSSFRLDHILQHNIKSFLHQYKPLIDSWFFIRYNENGDHIRLRFKLKDITKGYVIITALTDSLKEELEIGSVADIKLCTYKKEVHRYSTMLMEQIEGHFHQDSRFVLNMLNYMLPDFAKYRLCMDIFDQVHDSHTIAQINFEHIINAIGESLKKEYKLDKDGLKKLNKLFKEFENQEMPTITKRALLLHKNLINSSIKVLENCPENFRSKLLADFMHMHINRLFVTNQRLHELVIYDFYHTIRKRRKYLPNSVKNAV